MLGLVNFALGMGLAIYALAWWLTIDRRRIWTRLALFNGVSAILLLLPYRDLCGLRLHRLPTRGDAAAERILARLARARLVDAAVRRTRAVLWLFTAPIETRFGGPGMKIVSLAAPMLDDSLRQGIFATTALTIVLVAAVHRGALSLAPVMRYALGGPHRGDRRAAGCARRGGFHRRAVRGCVRLSGGGFARRAARRCRDALDRDGCGRDRGGAGRRGGAGLGRLRAAKPTTFARRSAPSRPEAARWSSGRRTASA